jgi:hypothetical protein
VNMDWQLSCFSLLAGYQCRQQLRLLLFYFNFRGLKKL